MIVQHDTSAAAGTDRQTPALPCTARLSRPLGHSHVDSKRPANLGGSHEFQCCISQRGRHGACAFAWPETHPPTAQATAAALNTSRSANPSPFQLGIASTRRSNSYQLQRQRQLRLASSPGPLAHVERQSDESVVSRRRAQPQPKPKPLVPASGPPRRSRCRGAPQISRRLKHECECAFSNPPPVSSPVCLDLSFNIVGCCVQQVQLPQPAPSSPLAHLGRAAWGRRKQCRLLPACALRRIFHVASQCPHS